MPEPAIIWDNPQTPKSIHFDDVYFNTTGAIDEVKYIFIEGNQIIDRFSSSPHDTFVVAETGFGTGLNFLILWDVFLQFRQQNHDHHLKKLKFYSIEKYPLLKQEQQDVYAKILFNQNNVLWLLSRQLRIDKNQRDYLFDDVQLTNFI